ncbi:MAG TPA: phospholipid carrier-dependent glycosyltransferase [Aggregatilineales bacterium]|nr:phospholipid carrier-dependent glycosyltransferase [Aggregatilineales bacterium]
MRSLFTGLLALYVLAGVQAAPFHGDESTIIHKSRDWYLLIQGNLPALLYSATPSQRAEQELRLLNGVISDYAIGMLSWFGGSTIQAVNEQWDWGADWAYNFSSGHAPTDAQLFVGRMSSALMTILSVALVFAIARRLGGKGSAFLAAVIYATFPSVLLNGRRAMFEGATLLAITLVIATGLIVSECRNSSSSTSVPTRWANQRAWIALGLASGFALASKHILVITLFGVFAAILLLKRRHILQTLALCVLAGVLALIAFLALNPAWWSAPLVVPGEVLRLREDLANGQIEQYGGYSSTGQRLSALISDVFSPPQYYEDQRGWPQWIAPQIAAYEASGFEGITWSGIGIALAYMLGIAGFVVWVTRALQRQPLPGGNKSGHRESPSLILVWVVLISSIIGIYILTPLPWQRYYLPLAAPLALAVGAAGGWLISWFQEALLPLARRLNAR